MPQHSPLLCSATQPEPELRSGTERAVVAKIKPACGWRQIVPKSKRREEKRREACRIFVQSYDVT
jgi:hypothetical protein